MTLDKKLNWSHHIKEKSKKAKSLLYLTKRAISSTWGPQPALMQWAYTGIVRPRLTYGCHLWANCAQQQTKIKNFTGIQRAALLPLRPVRAHIPTNGLEIITHTPPIDLHVIELSLNTYRTICRHNQHYWKGKIASKESHLLSLQEITNSIHLSNLPDDKIPASFPIHTQHKFTLNLNSITNRSEYQACTTQTPIEIYTDGSHISNRTGYGYCIFSNTEPNKPELLAEGNGFLGKHSTVFQAETFAIEAAIHHIQLLTNENKINKNTPLTIHSDSQSTLKALAKEPTHSKTTLSCQNTLLTACSERTITLRWVKAHCGIQGNERADQEAKKGALLNSPGPEPWLPLPTTFFKKEIKKLMDFHWTAR